MKGIIIKEVELKENNNSKSETLKILSANSRVEILKPRFGLYENPWVYVQSQDGFIGYIKQESLIEIESKYTLVISKADVFGEASSESSIVFVLSNQSQILITDLVLNESCTWYKITDSYGRTGYINSSDEIELSRELVDFLSQNKGGMLTTFSNGGSICGVVLITYSIFRLIYFHNSTGTISGFSVLLLGTGILAIILDIVRKRRKKKYE